MVSNLVEVVGFQTDAFSSLGLVWLSFVTVSRKLFYSCSELHASKFYGVWLVM